MVCRFVMTAAMSAAALVAFAPAASAQSYSGVTLSFGSGGYGGYDGDEHQGYREYDSPRYDPYQEERREASGVERRRMWTDEQKRALVAAACEPGASVADVARRADLRTSQLYRWRRDLAEPAAGGFAALTVSPEPEVPAAGAAVVLEVGGAVLRIAADAPLALVAAVVRSLRR